MCVLLQNSTGTYISGRIISLFLFHSFPLFFHLPDTRSHPSYLFPQTCNRGEFSLEVSNDGISYSKSGARFRVLGKKNRNNCSSVVDRYSYFHIISISCIFHLMELVDLHITGDGIGFRNPFVTEIFPEKGFPDTALTVNVRNLLQTSKLACRFTTRNEEGYVSPLKITYNRRGFLSYKLFHSYLYIYFEIYFPFIFFYFFVLSFLL